MDLINQATGELEATVTLTDSRTETELGAIEITRTPRGKKTKVVVRLNGAVIGERTSASPYLFASLYSLDIDTAIASVRGTIAYAKGQIDKLQAKLDAESRDECFAREWAKMVKVYQGYRRSGGARFANATDAEIVAEAAAHAERHTELFYDVLPRDLRALERGLLSCESRLAKYLAAKESGEPIYYVHSWHRRRELVQQDQYAENSVLVGAIDLETGEIC